MPLVHGLLELLGCSSEGMKCLSVPLKSMLTSAASFYDVNTLQREGSRVGEGFAYVCLCFSENVCVCACMFCVCVMCVCVHTSIFGNFEKTAKLSFLNFCTLIGVLADLLKWSEKVDRTACAEIMHRSMKSTEMHLQA